MICTKNDLQADLGPVSSDFVSPAARNSDESCWNSGPNALLKGQHRSLGLDYMSEMTYLVFDG